MGIKDMFSMMKDAAAMQKNMKRIQGALRQKTVEFKAGQVTVVARGDATIASIKIDPAIIDPAKPAVLEKAVLQAVEGALLAAQRASGEEVKKLAAEMGLPPGLAGGR